MASVEELEISNLHFKFSKWNLRMHVRNSVCQPFKEQFDSCFFEDGLGKSLFKRCLRFEHSELLTLTAMGTWTSLSSSWSTTLSAPGRQKKNSVGPLKCGWNFSLIKSKLICVGLMRTTVERLTMKRQSGSLNAFLTARSHLLLCKGQSKTGPDHI